jgi:hypothetical protein
MATTATPYLGTLHPMRELGANPNHPRIYRSQDDGKIVLAGSR